MVLAQREMVVALAQVVKALLGLIQDLAQAVTEITVLQVMEATAVAVRGQPAQTEVQVNLVGELDQAVQE